MCFTDNMGGVKEGVQFRENMGGGVGVQFIDNMGAGRGCSL